MRLTSFFSFLFAVFLSVMPAFSANLSGLITDSQTGEPVPGAMVKIVGHDYSTVSNAEGKFGFVDLPDTKNELVITHLGYEIRKVIVRPNETGFLPISLDPKILEGQDVIVTATRAQKGETPAAFSDMSRQEINSKYWAQDTPMLLSSLPNVFAYSDAGNGIGYSYLKIRGFDQKRISVMLNGIPLNDAESHEVFWIDLPDFANNVQDIQVQRGVGTSLYGQSTLGGVVNLVTNDFSAVPELKFESGYGSYNSKKLSISGNSGLINDSYVFYGRYSRIETDGYRDNSWTEMYAYFIGVARYDENMTWKFNTYGGPEKSHLAYKGISRGQLTADRTYNELEYEGEIDQFNQPHYELLHDWKISDKINLANTIFYFHGEGSYTQYRSDRYVEEYFPGIYAIEVSDTTLAPRDYYDIDDSGDFVLNANGLYEIQHVDLIRRRTVKEQDGGWIPRLTIGHDKGKLTLGGELRVHSGDHYGDVTWAGVYPQNFAPDYRYYDYKAKSNTFTIYAHEAYELSDKLTVVTNLQYQRHNYKLENDKIFDVWFDRDFDFFSPRAGFNYKASENTNLFFSASMASRHPAFKDIYDPTDYWSNPNYKPSNFDSSGAGMEFAGPELNPEKLIDLELGTSFTKSFEQFRLKGEINLYRMQINDEIIPYAGQIDDDGYPISGNAEKTLHQGIEFVWDALIQDQLTVSGNASFNDDHFVDYVEYGFDWDLWQADTIDQSDNRIGGFPSMIINYRFGYNIQKLVFGISGKYVGKQFIDNGEQYELDPYHILDADIAYDFGELIGFKSLKASLRIHNLSNTEYEQAAYIEPDDGSPRYMVGAQRNFFVSITTEF